MLKAAVIYRLLRCNQAIVNKGIQLSRFLAGQPGLDIKILDGTANASGVLGRVKAVNQSDAMASQEDVTSFPTGESIPIPVMTTRRLLISPITRLFRL